jgi:O-antigen/teichoic acid export membrane protein
MTTRSVTGRAIWGVADQAFSSLTNFALSAIVARNTSPDGFGAFALIFSTYVLVVGIARTMTTLPIIVRFSAVTDDAWRGAAAATTGSAFVLGILGGLASAAAALAFPAGRAPLLVLAVCLPGLLVQEAWRHAFIAKGKPSAAFLNDVVWAIALVPGMLLAVTRSSGPAPFVLAWGVSGSLGALVGIAQARVLPRPRSAFTWVRDHRDLSFRAVGEFAANTGSTQLVIYAAGAFGGLSAAGALRGGQILLGPLNTAFQGIWIVSLAEFVRVLRWRPQLFTRVAIGLSLVLAIAAVAYAAIFLAFGATLGPIVLGQTWKDARSVLLPLSVAAVAWGAWMGSTVGLRALQEFGRSLRVRSIVSAMNVIGGLIGVVLDGARGAAWGLGITYALGVGLWWREFAMARRQPSEAAQAHLASFSSADLRTEEVI